MRRNIKLNIVFLKLISALYVAITLNSCYNETVGDYHKEYFIDLCESCSGKHDSFLFFTDPHIDHQQIYFDSSLRKLVETYGRFPLDFCLCGGDWLNDKDTKEQAVEKLHVIDSVVHRQWGQDFYMILGNHDTNYQGKYNEMSEQNTGIIEQDKINEIFFKNYGSAYYTFSTSNTLFIVLDSGIDWISEMTNYRWEQINWLAEQLMHNTFEHIILGFHIFSNKLPQPELFAQNILEVGEAFNKRENITKNRNSYDFSNAVGSVACVICGHLHKDFISYRYSIPVVGTTHLIAGKILNYDLCLIDWEANVMHLFRVGNGASRLVNLSSY